MRKTINLIIAAVMFVASFSTLYVCVNITSLDRELGDYMRGTPYSPTIRVGDMGFYSRVIMGVPEGMSRLNDLVYYLAGEITSPSSRSSETNPPPTLTEQEVSDIRGLAHIAAVFEFDQRDSIIRWTVAAPIGLGNVVCPVTPEYLKALRPPLKEGRYFEETDPPNVLLVHEDYAKNIATGPDILGKSVAVYTNAGKEQFTIIGVLARIPSSYLGSTSLPASIVIPYRTGTSASSYTRGDGKVIALPSRPQVWLVPQEGYEQQLLSEIRNILGKDKYETMVSSSTWEFENSFGVQLWRERVATLSASAVLTLLTGAMTIGSFVYFDVSSRKKELGIRLSIGAAKAQIAREYATTLLRLLCMSFAAAALMLVLLLPLFTRYNALGEYVGPYRSPSETLRLALSDTAAITAFGLLSLLVLAVTTVLVLRFLRGTPAHLLLSSGETKEQRTHLLAVLALVMIVSVTTLFASLSLMNTIRRTTQDLLLDVPEGAFWISPVQSPLPYVDKGAKYSLDDYHAVREAIKSRAVVGCRIATPTRANIPLPSDGDLDLRISGATEDFVVIYDLAVNKGRFLMDADTGKCVVGAAIASSMGLQLGDVLVGDEVIGILNAHSSLIDRTVYVPLAESFTILSAQGMSVLLLIKPLDGHSDEIATIVLDLLESRHPGYSRGSIVDIRDSIDAVIRSREGVYVVLSVFTLLSFMSALLYLSATFLIQGIQKTKEIGIKRAIGAEQQMIQKEFVWKGLRIGLTALGIGVCAGSLATFVLAKSEGMTFSLQPGLLLGFVMSCCACLLLASFIPAAYASRIAPVDALRKE